MNTAPYPYAARSRPAARTGVLVLLFLALIGLGAFLLFNGSVPPLLWGLGVASALGFLAAAWRIPEFFLVASAFVPQLKSYWPFSLAGRVGDLTVVMLAGLALGLFFLILRIAIRWDTWTFEAIVFRQRHALLFFGLFVIAVGLSCLYTSAPSYGSQKALRLAFIGGMFLLAPLFLLRTERAFDRFTLIFTGFALITALQMIVSLRERTASDAETDITRIGAGWLMGMGLLLVLCVRMLEDPKWQRILVISAVPILSAGLIASAARGAIVAFALALPLALFSNRERRKSGMAWILIVVLALCAAGAFFVLRSADPGKYSAKISELVQLSEGKSGSGSGTKRLAFYRETWEAIPESIWMGNGAGSWGVFYYGNDARAYPHNLVLEILFEEGVVGLAIFAGFFVAVGFAAVRTMQMAGAHFSVVGIILLYGLTVSMFSGDLDDNRLLWLWAGVALAIYRNVALARTRPGHYSRMALRGTKESYRRTPIRYRPAPNNVLSTGL